MSQSMEDQLADLVVWQFNKFASEQIGFIADQTKNKVFRVCATYTVGEPHWTSWRLESYARSWIRKITEETSFVCSVKLYQCFKPRKLLESWEPDYWPSTFADAKTDEELLFLARALAEYERDL